jgi:diphosphomevalonate decarboxylase
MKNIDYTYNTLHPTEPLKGFQSTWWAPSNIALVKYWGKKEGLQLPANPSLSLTLSEAKTQVNLEVRGDSEGEWIELFFGGQPMPSFIPKIEKFFTNASTYLPFLKDLKFTIRTKNTFPHSAGIASSASSMAAMALNLVELEEEYRGEKFKEEEFYARASFLARMGSGSACRSLYPHGASWGQWEDQGSDILADKLDVHPIFKNMYDTIVVVSSKEKKVSSRAGHGLMENHFFGKARYFQAVENWKLAMEWIKDGSWDHLGSVVEEEALSLHAMMMTSRPGYMLMEPETITAIHKIREFRFSTEHPVYFTLDAGPNLHLLYPEESREAVWTFINEMVNDLGEGVSVIDDRVGMGPEKVTNKGES